MAILLASPALAQEEPTPLVLTNHEAISCLTKQGLHLGDHYIIAQILVAIHEKEKIEAALMACNDAKIAAEASQTTKEAAAKPASVKQ